MRQAVAADLMNLAKARGLQVQDCSRELKNRSDHNKNSATVQASILD